MKKSIGLPDIRPPERACQDPKCAWHGRLALRGAVFRGTVKSVRGQKTAIIEWPYHQYIRKYERFERRASRIAVHNPDCIRAKEGNRVVAVECRPLAKTKAAVIVGIVQSALGPTARVRQAKEQSALGPTARVRHRPLKVQKRESKIKEAKQRVEKK